MRQRPKAPGKNEPLTIEDLARGACDALDKGARPGLRSALAAPVVGALARGGRGDLARMVVDSMAFEPASHFEALFRLALLDPDVTRARAAIEDGHAAAARYLEAYPARVLWVRCASRAAAEVRLGDPGAAATLDALRSAPSAAFRNGLSSLIVALVEGGALDEALGAARETSARPPTPGTTPGFRSTDPACEPLALALARAGRVDEAFDACELLAGAGIPHSLVTDACERGEPLSVIERWASADVYARAIAIELLVERGRPSEGGALYARWPAGARGGSHGALWTAARVRLGGTREPGDAAVLRTLFVEYAPREPTPLFRLALEAAHAVDAEHAPSGARGREVDEGIAIGLLRHRADDSAGALDALRSAEAKALELGFESSVVDVTKALIATSALDAAVSLLGRLRAEQRSHAIRALAVAYAQLGDLGGAVASASMVAPFSDAHFDALAHAVAVVLPEHRAS